MLDADRAASVSRHGVMPCPAGSVLSEKFHEMPPRDGERTTEGREASDGSTTARERWTLVATILGSSLAFIDSTVVNVAIPRLGQDLHAGAAGAQWTIGAYLLPLAAFVLVGGALGDRYGHRRMFLIGVSVFAAASFACGVAQSMPQLLVSRGVQGAAAALFVP